MVWLTWTRADWARLKLEVDITALSVAFCLLLLRFPFSLYLLSDEPLFLLKLPGSLLSQTGNLVETDIDNKVMYTDILVLGDSRLCIFTLH